MLRKLSDEEMAEYRRRFAEPGEGRRPTPTWPREIPIEGDPADCAATIRMVWSGDQDGRRGGRPQGGPSPVEFSLAAVLEHARSLPAQTEVTIKRAHFVQEDDPPDEIGRPVAGWMKMSGWSRESRGRW